MISSFSGHGPVTSFGHVPMCRHRHLCWKPEREWRSIYQETLIQVLLPVPLPILFPIQHLTQSQLVTTRMIEPFDFTPLAS